MKKTVAITLICTLFAIAQSCTSSMILNVKHPARIDVPADLDSIIIVDRTNANKGNGRQFATGLESVLTGEPIGGDKYGIDACKKELIKIVSNNERLTLVSFNIPELSFGSLQEIQKPLTKNEVDSICKQYGAEGILSLEFFDSDRVYTNPNVVTNTANQPKVAQVYTQWRLYYKETETIIDFQELTTRGTHYQSVSGIGAGQYRAIANAGMEAADLYVKKIVPSYYRESRMYYTSGSKELKMAAKAMQNELWEQAKNYYLLMIDTETDQKILGKATYNLALIFEVEGNLAEAYKYANQSIQAGNKNAPRYAGIIKRLIDEKPLIESQMQRK
jgi:hypothetical protein